MDLCSPPNGTALPASPGPTDVEYMVLPRTHGTCPSGMWCGMPRRSLVGSPVLAHAGNTGNGKVDMDAETIRGMGRSTLC